MTAFTRERRSGGRSWHYRAMVKLPDGSYVRICGTPTENTRRAAVAEEAARIRRLGAMPARKGRRRDHEIVDGPDPDEPVFDRVQELVRTSTPEGLTALLYQLFKERCDLKLEMRRIKMGEDFWARRARVEIQVLQKKLKAARRLVRRMSR